MCLKVPVFQKIPRFSDAIFWKSVNSLTASSIFSRPILRSVINFVRDIEKLLINLHDSIQHALLRAISRINLHRSTNHTLLQAIELAYFGGQILHPSAMDPLIEANIDLLVRNIENQGFKGTLIAKESRAHTTRPAGDEGTPKTKRSVFWSHDLPVKVITSIDNISMVNIKAGSWASVTKVGAATQLSMNVRMCKYT